MPFSTSTLAGVVYLFLCIASPQTLFAQLESPTPQAGDTIDSVAIRLTRFGPYPASFSHVHGPFVLLIQNHSGFMDDTYSLILKPKVGDDPAKSASLLDFHSDHTSQRDFSFIKLQSGDYQLRFKTHPDWVVSITITAK